MSHPLHLRLKTLLIQNAGEVRARIEEMVMYLKYRS